MKRANRATITGERYLYNIWPLSGFKVTRAKQQLASQETKRSPKKFLDENVIYTDNSLEFGKSCEDLQWSHHTSAPYRSETNGTALRTVRRVTEGTSAQRCFRSPGWMKNGGRFLRMLLTVFCATFKTLTTRDLENRRPTQLL